MKHLQERFATMFRHFMAACVLLTSLVTPALSATGEAIKDAQGSVVRIVAFVANGKKTSVTTGTGFVVDGYKHVVTNLHVVENALPDDIMVADGGIGEHSSKVARIIAKSTALDLAILEVPTLSKRTPLKLFKGKPVEVAQNAWAIGFPGVADEASDSREQVENDFISATVSSGIINKTTRTKEWGNKTQEVNILHHSAAVNHGNSGGPLLNECANVIGVNTQIDTSDGNTVNKALNVVELADFLSENSIQYDTGNGQCATAATGSVATPTAASGSTDTAKPAAGNGNSFPWLTVAAVGLVVLALAGLAILFLNKPTALSKPQAVAAPVGAVPPVKPPLATGGYVLQGLDGHENLRFALDRDSIHIGRSASMNDYAIADDSVSRRHVSLRREQDGWLLEDENTTNGTSLNGQRLVSHRTHRLSANDKIGRAHV
jgi:S1-C subfamily serine protease